MRPVRGEVVEIDVIGGTGAFAGAHGTVTVTPYPTTARRSTVPGSARLAAAPSRRHRPGIEPLRGGADRWLVRQRGGVITEQIALVSKTTEIGPNELERAAAALNTQLTRDFGPAWNVDAAVTAARRVPTTSRPLIVTDDATAAGVHLDDHGRPTAVVDYADDWTTAASHELLEMCADPYGNRLMTARAVKPGQGRVEYLVEVCDPCEAVAYESTAFAVSDFYTPRYFDPATRAGVRYSHTGAITAPARCSAAGTWKLARACDRRVVAAALARGAAAGLPEPRRAGTRPP